MKIKSTTHNLTYLLLITALNSTTIFANDNADQWNVKIGAASLMSNQPWKGINSQEALAPYIDARIGNWSFGVEHLVNYRYQIKENFSFSTGLGLRTEGYDSDGSLFSTWSDNEIFIGYKPPKVEVAAKTHLEWRWFNFETTQDISSNSKSNTASITLKIPLYQNNRGISVNLDTSSHWVSADYVNYYYGISESQIDESVGRMAYQTNSSAVNNQLSLNAVYPLNRRWIITGNISRTLLDDNIIDSPLIGDNKIDNIVLALVYQL